MKAGGTNKTGETKKTDERTKPDERAKQTRGRNRRVALGPNNLWIVLGCARHLLTIHNAIWAMILTRSTHGFFHSKMMKFK